jgi:hypothetical protein
MQYVMQCKTKYINHKNFLSSLSNRLFRQHLQHCMLYEVQNAMPYLLITDRLNRKNGIRQNHCRPPVLRMQMMAKLPLVAVIPAAARPPPLGHMLLA